MASAKHDSESTAPNRKTSFSDEAYAVAKQRLTNGSYAPDSYIDDRALANELNISRTPVREALIRLSNEGMVEFVPRRGIRVMPITTDDLSEAFDVITAMEFMAVDLIVAAPDRHHDTLHDLQDCVDRMERAKRDNDIERWIDHDETFHRTLLIRCGNNEVTRIGIGLRDKVQRVLRVAKRLWPFAQETLTAHHDLIREIARGDGSAARRVQYRYRRAKEQRLLECLRQTGVPQF